MFAAPPMAPRRKDENTLLMGGAAEGSCGLCDASARAGRANAVPSRMDGPWDWSTDGMAAVDDAVLARVGGMLEETGHSAVGPDCDDDSGSRGGCTCAVGLWSLQWGG